MSARMATVAQQIDNYKEAINGFQKAIKWSSLIDRQYEADTKTKRYRIVNAKRWHISYLKERINIIKKKECKSGFPYRLLNWFHKILFISLRVWKCGLTHFHTSWYKISYDTRAKNIFLTSVSLQHEPKASDVITLVKKTFHRTRSVMYYFEEVCCLNLTFSQRKLCGYIKFFKFDIAIRKIKKIKFI